MQHFVRNGIGASGAGRSQGDKLQHCRFQFNQQTQTWITR